MVCWSWRGDSGNLAGLPLSRLIMSKKSPAPKSARTLARSLSRAEDKAAEARQKLWFLEAGGSAARPVEVRSAAIIESRATSAPCPRCGGELRVKDHEAKVLDSEGRETTTERGTPLRLLTLACFQCGARQRSYFRVVAALPS